VHEKAACPSQRHAGLRRTLAGGTGLTDAAVGACRRPHGKPEDWGRARVNSNGAENTVAHVAAASRPLPAAGMRSVAGVSRSTAWICAVGGLSDRCSACYLCWRSWCLPIAWHRAMPWSASLRRGRLEAAVGQFECPEQRAPIRPDTKRGHRWRHCGRYGAYLEDGAADDQGSFGSESGESVAVTGDGWVGLGREPAS